MEMKIKQAPSTVVPSFYDPKTDQSRNINDAGIVPMLLEGLDAAKDALRI